MVCVAESDSEAKLHVDVRVKGDVREVKMCLCKKGLSLTPQHWATSGLTSWSFLGTAEP